MLVKKPSLAIFCSANWGPRFGNGSDLGAIYENFNVAGHCRSNPDCTAFKVPTDADGNSILTGTKEQFKCEELEVYHIL